MKFKYKSHVVVVLLLLLALGSSVVFAKEKVLLDTDMVQLFDDGAAMIMLANAPNIELLGVCTVAGNTWVQEGTAYALRQLEIIGRTDIPVAIGAQYPLRAGRGETLALERELFGIGPSSYIGSWSRPEPASYLQLQSPPYGGYPVTKPIEQSAVDFIIDTVRANPGEVTILAIGPCTNIALAIRKDPGIVPLVKRIVYMGGAIDVPGNTTPAAEFNWWYDPEAARMTVRAPWAEQLVVGLDVCEKVHFTIDEYHRLIASGTEVAKMIEAIYGPRFEADPKRTSYVWDTIAAAVIIDPTLITEVETRWIDVNDEFGLDYGRSLGYKIQGPAGTQKADILFTIDEARFWDLVVDLLK